MLNFNQEDTIMALATAPGTGAIAVFRISGSSCFEIASKVLRNSKGNPIDFSCKKSHTAFLAIVFDGQIVDEVLVTIFKGPHSYTGEDTLEISCHGSLFIQQRMLELFTQAGARLAEPGEFTMRSFLNGKMDLSQAEAVADLIASDAEGAHQLAIQQLRGGFSNEIKAMREELIQFAALIELELDFSEEDVEFANREQLLNSVSSLQDKLNRLISSFEWGNVMKSGVPVVIAGKPNAGKSTLLNALLNEERAIVSDIAGTTRDTIEEVLTLDGIKFRFVDTAGLRRTDDTIEKIGVERTWEKIRQSPVILYLFDVNTTTTAGLEQELEDLKPNLPDGYHLILLGNKSDGNSAVVWNDKFNHTSDWLRISAKERTGLDELQKQLVAFVTQGKLESGETVVTNARHVAALRQTHHSLQQVSSGLSAGLTHDLIAGELRYALYHLGLITGTISNEDLLDTIFSKFCIGK